MSVPGPDSPVPANTCRNASIYSAEAVPLEFLATVFAGDSQIAGQSGGTCMMEVAALVEARLLAAGVNPTPQRLEIGSLLFPQPVHLSAEQILARLRDAGSTVSKATVYNTLNLFTEQGLLRAISVDPDRLVYDSNTAAHHHFYNQDTGELMDIEPGSVLLPGIPAPPQGTRAESVEVLIRVRSG
jgi:Fur family transcriptional regulator, iron response regulator